MTTVIVIEQYISIYGPFILTALGIIGNVLSILIFLSPRYRRQSSHFYLLSLALSDLCFLIIYLVEDTFRNHNELYKSRINFLDRSPTIICILVQYARNVTRLLSSWIIVSFTIERLIVVFHPLKRAIICRRKIARFVVLFLFLLTLLSNINVPFHYGTMRTSNDTDDTICDILLKYRSIYMKFAISTMTTVYLLPMCIIGVVNLLICCELWRKSSLVETDETTRIAKEKRTLNPHRRLSYFSEVATCKPSSRRSSVSSLGAKQIQRGSINLPFVPSQSIGPLLNTSANSQQINGSIIYDEERRRTESRSLSDVSSNYRVPLKSSVSSIRTYIQSRTHRVTLTLLLVSCSFLLLNSPYCALWIINYIHGFKNRTLISLKEISELFMLTNFCINFLLYCVSGKTFRRELVYLIRRQWKDLYERTDGERFTSRKCRNNIEIQLNNTKVRSRSISVHHNNQQNL